MHLLLILQVSNKEFPHIVEGNNIPTQPRRSVSRDSHLDVMLQPATGSASTSLASPACRIDSASARRSPSSRCCRTAHCFQLVSHTNNSRTVFSGLRKANRSRLGRNQNLPIQLKCTDSRPRSRWYQLRGLPLLGSECVCPQCNSSFVITRGKCQAIGVMPSRLSLKSSIETLTEKVELPSQKILQPPNAQWYDHSGTG